ncbi:MAG: hypothetical protein ACREMF_10220 [Gemmatimonadales bacterium]
MRRSHLVVVAFLVAGRAAAAQVDSGPPRRRPADTTGAAAADSAVPDTLERFLPAFTAATPPGPLPRGTRWRFDADSLVLSNIATLADLLTHIPGVYVARGGWYGAPEIVLYGGHGPVGLEIYWDGMPIVPLGRDSVWIDPARVPLAPVELIDVLVLPSTLRVYLVTGRPRALTPRTEVRVSTGDNSIAQYRGGFAKRWSSGMGLSLAADYRNIDGIIGSSTTAFNSVDLWLKAEYVPSPRAGIAYQILSSAWDRATQSALVDGWQLRRLDGVFQAFLASRDDALGTRVALTVARSEASRDTLVRDRALYQASVDISETRSRASAGFTVRLQDAARPMQIEARAAWQPLPFVTLAADARRAYYGTKGHGNRAHVSAGLQLPLGLAARGEVSWVEDFQAAVVRSDSFQRGTDYAGYVRWDERRVTIEVGGVRRDPFQPLGFAKGIRPVTSLGLLPHSTYASAFVAVRPLSGVQLAGWYFDPIRGGGDLEPPKHGRVTAAFYSKFWRVFKSGAFALRAEVAAESWSRSNLGGRDSGGAQLSLGPATFVETNIELRIADFTAYWLTRNYNGMRGSYVGGLGYPKHAQYYGVQWYFRN